MKIFITGGCGQCGVALQNIPYEKVFYDTQLCQADASDLNLIQGDINDIERLTAAMEGCNVVVHLAAASSIDSSWDEVLNNNIIGTKNVLEVAKNTGIEIFIFASSNHVVGMYELINAPEIYDLTDKVILTRDADLCPDSLYGVSKVFGEQLGKYYSSIGGPRFICLRIGALVHEDNPYAHAERGVANGKWQRESKQYEKMVNRLKSLWISQRDFNQLVRRSIVNSENEFEIFYALSDNPRRWLDIEAAKHQLGYKPQDNAEDWNSPESL